MKKVLLSALAAFCMLSVSAQATNEFVVAPAHVSAGTDATLDLVMVNDFEVSGLQFNVLLPKGITIAKNSKGKVAKTYSYVWVDRGDEIAWTETSSFKAVGNDEQINFAIGVGDDYIAEGEGAVMQLKVKVAADVQPGVYPIYVKCTKCSDLADEHAISAQYTSYVVVDGGKGELVVNNVLPATVSNELATEEAVTGLNLAAATGFNEAFTYVPGRGVSNVPAGSFDVAFETTGTGYSSFVMPFDYDFTGKEVYVLDGEITGNVASFKDAGAVQKGDKVLIKGAVKAVAKAALAEGANNKITGRSAYVKGDAIHVGTNVTVPAFRATWDAPAAASNLRIAINGELTGITAAEVEGFEATSFDLQGRQVQSAKNGVFVVNGKKQIVK